MRSSRRTTGLGIAVAALVAGAAAVPAETATTRQVTLEDISFSPATVKVRRGDSVRFSWQDGPYVRHDVRSTGKPRFTGASARTTGTHKVRFAKAGTYRYVCTLHPGMTGRVVVR